MTTTDAPMAPAAESAPYSQSTQAVNESFRPSLRPGADSRNVGDPERMVSAAAGTVLALLGLSRRGVPGLLIAGLGGALLYRGVSGQCPMYSKLGIDTTSPNDASQQGTHVAESYLINKSPEELYNLWHDFERLPTFMSNLLSVVTLDDKRSRWTARAPGLAGGTVEWEAEIVRDEPNSRIEWRSIPGSAVDNAGAVTFAKAMGDRGTLVTVALDYVPPAGQLGRWVAKLFGQAPEQQIKEDLRKLKCRLETGEIPTIHGQARGSCMGISGGNGQ